ncbi:MAG: helix-turn-helix transcriptional regulator [Ruminococcus sp.]|nr:helix-turn-helix transcriptional regulator [Ruminococcus sp.]
MSTIAKNIEMIIADKGMNIKHVAMKAGYSKQQFSNLMNGRKIIKPDDIIKIANALEVTPNDLFRVSNNKTA